MKKCDAIILRVDWLDRDALEAEVLLGINERELWAFCHPCNFVEGKFTIVELSVIEDAISEEMFWGNNGNEKKELVASESDRLRYYCYGQVISIHPVIVDCGDTELCLGDWLRDQSVVGAYVYFVIGRLDVRGV